MNKAQYWNKLWGDTPPLPVNNFARRAFKLIQSRPLNSLLELGCGRGRDAIYFAKKGLQVTALDFCPEEIDRLRRQNREITCLLADLRKLDFADSAFDIIYAHLSLHYFDDETTKTIFSKLYRILKKGGLLFVKCKSTDDRLCGKGKKIAEHQWENGHVRHFFTKGYMAANLKEFEVISLRKTASCYCESRSSFIEAIATK